MRRSSYKKPIYLIAAIIVLIECLVVELITENFIAFIVVVIFDLNLCFLLWRLDQMREDLDDYDEE